MFGAFGAIALVGLMMLGFASGPRWLRGLGIALMAAIALVASAIAAGLHRVGVDRHWTSDGPGMLVVMLGVAFFAPFALVAWGTLVAQIRSARFGLARRAGSPRVALALIAVGLSGCLASLVDVRTTSKPSHDAPIAALDFSPDGAQLFSLDAAGTLKTWRAASRHLDATRSDPALAGARSLLVSADGRHALALVPHGACVLALGGDDAPALVLPGVMHAALLSGGEVALAEGAELGVASLTAPRTRRPLQTLPSPVSALAADAQGWLAAALEDGSVLALERGGRAPRALAQLDAPARRLAFSPGGTWLVAAGADGRGHVIGARRGDVRALAPFLRLHAFAFVSDDALVFNTAEGDPEALALSLARLDVQPWLNHGRAILALAGADRAAESALAMGSDVFLARAPLSGHAYTSDATRLVDRRF